MVVAHRLATVIDTDKIIVLDAGKMVEFASPIELLRDDRSVFRALVDQSPDREGLLSQFGLS
jgi:ABC-type multidrug transport system fused ATPase/permease subunit